MFVTVRAKPASLTVKRATFRRAHLPRRSLHFLCYPIDQPTRSHRDLARRRILFLTLPQKRRRWRLLPEYHSQDALPANASSQALKITCSGTGLAVTSSIWNGPSTRARSLVPGSLAKISIGKRPCVHASGVESVLSGTKSLDEKSATRTCTGHGPETDCRMSCGLPKIAWLTKARAERAQQQACDPRLEIYECPKVPGTFHLRHRQGPFDGHFCQVFPAEDGILQGTRSVHCHAKVMTKRYVTELSDSGHCGESANFLSFTHVRQLIAAKTANGNPGQVLTP